MIQHHVSHFQILLAFLCSLGMLSNAKVYAQSESLQLTLDDCIQYALENNVTLQNSKFDEYIAQKDVSELIGTGLPQVEATADLNYNFKLPVFVLPGENGEPQDVTFGLPWQGVWGGSLSQLIFDGRFFLGVKASTIYVDLTELNTQRNKEQTAYDVSKAYYSALLSQERLNILDANIERVEKLYTETNALFEEGYAEKIDVERLQINLNNLKAERSSALQLVGVGIDLLKFQMGMPVNTNIELTENMESLDISPASPTLVSDFDYTQRTEYSLLQTQKIIEEFRLKSYKAGFLPTLYGFASYNWNRQWDGDQSFNFQTGVVGATLTLPIFDGNQKLRQIQRSNLLIRKIDNDMTQLANSSSLEIHQAVANLNNAYTNLEAQEKNRELADKVYNITRIKYKEGVGSSLEVNDAETQLKQAESNYLTSLFEYLISDLDLQRLSGAFREYE